MINAFGMTRYFGIIDLWMETTKTIDQAIYGGSIKEIEQTGMYETSVFFFQMHKKIKQHPLINSPLPKSC